MDDNHSTTAFTGSATSTAIWVQRRYNGLMWHCFCDDGCRSDTKNAKYLYTISFASFGGGIGATRGDNGVKARAFIKARYNALWNRVPTAVISDDKSRITADIVMGQFLHYEQDFYAHRQFVSIEPREEDLPEQQVEEGDNTYWPYGTKWGHAADGDGAIADQVKLRPYLAKIMIEDCYSKIAKFASYRAISSPNPLTLPLAPLIDAIVAAYGPGTLGRVGKGLTFKSYITYEFPSQEHLNDKLKQCLSEHYASYWPQSAKILPVYGGETHFEPHSPVTFNQGSLAFSKPYAFMHGPLTLPYDDINEPLTPWIKKFKAISDTL